jgi:hypothetical protein
VEGEIELSGGGVTAGVIRIGDTVRRSSGPWTPTIHAHLHHLEERGFLGAPRALGFDEKGREALSVVEGVVASSSSSRRGHASAVPAPLAHRARAQLARRTRNELRAALV